MEEAILRRRYSRSNTNYRKRRKDTNERSSLILKIIKQTFFCICIMLIIVIIKNINTTATNFVSEKVRNVLFQNIEIKNIFIDIEDLVGDLLKIKTKIVGTLPSEKNS